MIQKIESDAVDALFGGEAGLAKLVKNYTAALAAHAKTVDVPRPTSHPFVEQIVRMGGEFEVVPSPRPEPVVEPVFEPIVVPEPPEPTFEENKAALYQIITGNRVQSINAGVLYKGHRFSADDRTANAMVAALIASEGQSNLLVRWQDADNGYIELERSDLLVVLKLVRERTQAAFDNEYRLVRLIAAAATKQELKKINTSSNWPELPATLLK